MDIDEARTLLASVPPSTGPFHQIVLLVTADMVFWCDAARYEFRKPWHFVWTEHHGSFFEHEDEVAKIHVTRTSGSHEKTIRKQKP